MTIGIIFLILSHIINYILNRVGTQLKNGINEYVEEEHKKRDE